jgi:hypothetical protein
MLSRLRLTSSVSCKNGVGGVALGSGAENQGRRDKNDHDQTSDHMKPLVHWALHYFNLKGI